MMKPPVLSVRTPVPMSTPLASIMVTYTPLTGALVASSTTVPFTDWACATPQTTNEASATATRFMARSVRDGMMLIQTQVLRRDYAAKELGTVSDGSFRRQ